jgi:hypothetical protein
MELTGAEKALYKATYDFVVLHEKLSPAEATQRAEQKIIQKRAMASKIKSKH